MSMKWTILAVGLVCALGVALRSEAALSDASQKITGDITSMSVSLGAITEKQAVELRDQAQTPKAKITGQAQNVTMQSHHDKKAAAKPAKKSGDVQVAEICEEDCYTDPNGNQQCVMRCPN